MRRRRLSLAAVVAAVCVAGGLSPAGAAQDAVSATPGDQIQVDGGSGPCVLGFLFKGSDGGAYMSTAGHCLLGTAEGPPKTWKVGAGPAVAGQDGQIGRLVFAENRDSPETADDYDFALVRLDRGVRGSAALPVHGAPTGLHDDRGTQPETLRTYGHSAFGTVSPARELIAPNTRHQDHVYAHGPVFFGDSGAPVLDAHGRAVGTVQGGGAGHVGVGLGTVTAPHDGAFTIIGRLGPVVEHASSALRLRLILVQKN